MKTPKARPAQKRRRGNIGWKPADDSQYHEKLNAALETFCAEQIKHIEAYDLDAKFNTLAALIVETANSCRLIQKVERNRNT
eukprot:8931606-Karenia_brevis.AAC.1